jgi:hypothetical protein
MRSARGGMGEGGRESAHTGIVLHPIDTSTHTTRVHVSSPVTTEGVVDDDLVVAKVIGISASLVKCKPFSYVSCDFLGGVEGRGSGEQEKTNFLNKNLI